MYWLRSKADFLKYSQLYVLHRLSLKGTHESEETLIQGWKQILNAIVHQAYCCITLIFCINMKFKENSSQFKKLKVFTYRIKNMFTTCIFITVREGKKMKWEHGRRKEWKKKSESKWMGQGAICLFGSDRSAAEQISYIQLVCQKASILHCSGCKWDLLHNRGRAPNEGESETLSE